MFISLTDTRAINLDDVREFRLYGPYDPEPHTRCEIMGVWRDGTAFKADIDGTTFMKLMVVECRHEPFIPSPPGYFVLTYCDGSITRREAVIAWRLDGVGEGYHRAYTVLHRPASAHGLQYVLCPDGRVVASGERSWNNEWEWLEHMRGAAAQEAASQAAARAASEAHARAAAQTLRGVPLELKSVAPGKRS